MTEDELIERITNLRADLIAQRMLQDAMLIAMTPNAREALAHNFSQLSERWIASALANSTSPDDSTVHAVERSVNHVKLRLEHLPRS